MKEHKKTPSTEYQGSGSSANHDVFTLAASLRWNSDAENLQNGIGSASSGAVRYVETSEGPVRVLEYGFSNLSVKPLFIDLHGGGFILNSADIDEPMILTFLEKADIKIISIDYPKAPEHPYPSAVNAVWEIIGYYLSNAASLGIDSNQVGIGGHSAGGNLAAVMCLRSASEKRFSFRFQILDYPPLDLATSSGQKKQPKGCIPKETAEIFDACYLADHDPRSPYISPVYAEDELLKTLPPALIILAGQDSLHDEGYLYFQRLTAAGIPVRLLDYPGVLHGFTYKKDAAAQEAVQAMADFIAVYLSSTL